MNVMVIVGTRPEAIKMAPVIRELLNRNETDCFVLSTGQHKEMLEQALATFDIQTDLDLGLMRANQGLSELTQRILQGVGNVLHKERPDVVLVQGDTTTVLASALAASYERIQIGHVEAGLRTRDLQSPFPEELNRHVCDVMAKWCFAPTELAKNNLLREGISEDRIYVTGNTVVDALMWARGIIQECQPVLPTGLKQFVKQHRILLITAHRRESFGKPFEEICTAMLDIANNHDNVGLVYPVHLNPNVREPVMRILGDHERIHLCDPLSYEMFVWLLDQAYLVLTDSGGIQEEAPSFGKPVLVMRECTERPEGVSAGVVQLVGTDSTAIACATNTLLSNSEEYARRALIKNPYGDGLAAKRIVDALSNSIHIHSN